MPARKVPLRATSRLDHQARMVIAEPITARDTVKMAAPRVTWLGDMLTPTTNSFGVIRLLLALAVLVSHSVYLTTGQAHMEPLYRWTNYTLGQHGVQMFFFLSGILVAQSLFASRSVRDYATARALRIFPALFVCVLLTALVLGPLVTALPSVDYLKQQGTAAYIVKTASLWSGSAQLPGVFQTNTVAGAVNTSVWTLKYEVLCYVLLAIGGLAVLKTKRWREAAIVVFGLWAAAVLYQPVGLELHGGAKSTVQVLQYFMIFFGLGSLAYALRQWIPVHALMLIPLGGLFAVSLGARFQEPATALFLGYLMLWLSTFRFGGLRAFTNSNDYSYATYLYHMPVSQVLLYLWPQMELIPLIMATAGIVLWLAFLSWELIERPALSLRHTLWASLPASSSRSSIVDVIRERRRAANAATRTTATASSMMKTPPSKRVAIESAAALAVSRAADRIAKGIRQRATASPQSAAPVVPVPSEPVGVDQSARAGGTEPGAAHVWRPMPAPKKLRIHDEAVDAGATVAPAVAQGGPPRTAPASAAVSRSLSPIRPKDALRRPRTERSPSPASDVSVDTPLSGVPASRIAFAMKRPAASRPEARQAIEAITPAATEPSRAVVALADDEHGSISKQTRYRVAQPRPSWTRPIGSGRPRSV